MIHSRLLPETLFDHRLGKGWESLKSGDFVLSESVSKPSSLTSVSSHP